MSDEPRGRGWAVSRVRVVLALGPAPAGAPHRMADLAAALADRLSAAVEAILIEDEAVLRVGSAALSRHFSLLPGSAGTPLDSQSLEADLRRAADRLRTAVFEACERRRVKASFRVVRGRPEEAMPSAVLGEPRPSSQVGRPSSDAVTIVLPGRAACLTAVTVERWLELLAHGSAIPLGPKPVSTVGVPVIDPWTSEGRAALRTLLRAGRTPFLLRPAAGA